MSEDHSDHAQASCGKDLPPALVIGDGPCALIAARALVEIGITVTIWTLGTESVTLYCSAPGFEPKQYFASLSDTLNDVETIRSERIPEVCREGNGFRVDEGHGRGRYYGCIFLTPGVTLRRTVESVPAGVEVLSPEGEAAAAGSAVFLLDYGSTSSPAAGMAAIRQAKDNQLAGGRSFLLMRHAPVAHLFGETLYESAKRAGVQFYRYGDEMPRIETFSEGSSARPAFRVTVRDIIESGGEVVIESDRVFVPPVADGSSVPSSVGRIVSNDLDGEGFLLSSSVHTHSGRSFVNGVYAVGSCTGTVDLIEVVAQAAAAAAKARAWMLQAESREGADTVSITEQCCRCLTCYRICPHSAISMARGSARSAVHALAAVCEECGICVSECPRMALDLVSFPEETVRSFLNEVRERHSADPVVVYGCSRSAVRAAARAAIPPEVLVFSVSCAGRVSEAMIGAALAAGAKGVLVVGCHNGNCASKDGTDWAEARVRAFTGRLDLLPGAEERVRFVTVAANEETRFRRIVAEFCSSIRNGIRSRECL